MIDRTNIPWVPPVLLNIMSFFSDFHNHYYYTIIVTIIILHIPIVQSQLADKTAIKHGIYLKPSWINRPVNSRNDFINIHD